MKRGRGGDGGEAWASSRRGASARERARASLSMCKCFFPRSFFFSSLSHSSSSITASCVPVGSRARAGCVRGPLPLKSRVPAAAAAAERALSPLSPLSPALRTKDKSARRPPPHDPDRTIDRPFRLPLTDRDTLAPSTLEGEAPLTRSNPRRLRKHTRAPPSPPLSSFCARAPPPLGPVARARAIALPRRGTLSVPTLSRARCLLVRAKSRPREGTPERGVGSSFRTARARLLSLEEGSAPSEGPSWPPRRTAIGPITRAAHSQLMHPARLAWAATAAAAADFFFRVAFGSAGALARRPALDNPAPTPDRWPFGSAPNASTFPRQPTKPSQQAARLIWCVPRLLLSLL